MWRPQRLASSVSRRSRKAGLGLPPPVAKNFKKRTIRPPKAAKALPPAPANGFSRPPSVQLPIGWDEFRLFSDQLAVLQSSPAAPDRLQSCLSNSKSSLPDEFYTDRETNSDQLRSCPEYSGGRGSTLTQQPHRKPTLTITIDSVAVLYSLGSKPTSCGDRLAESNNV